MPEGLRAQLRDVPLELVFCELYLFEADARRREMYFKTTSGKKSVKLLPRIYDLFFRGSELLKGSGLGLYLVKNAIENLAVLFQFPPR